MQGLKRESTDLPVVKLARKYLKRLHRERKGRRRTARGHTWALRRNVNRKELAMQRKGQGLYLRSLKRIHEAQAATVRSSDSYRQSMN